MTIPEKIRKKFGELYKEEPLLFRSPGRVNLIGEHTDYNEGYVLPAAIDKDILFGITARDDNKVSIFSIDIDQEVIIKINDIQKSEKAWANYLIGVIDQLKKAGKKINGFNCVFGGDIPIGSGLSSSAAIEAGLTFALNHIFDLKIDRHEIVKLAQRSENEFVGVKCGIMDQFINIFGKENHVLKLDCRTLGFEYYPFNSEEYKIVLFDTQVKHSLASTEYNLRRRQCEEGVKILQHHYPALKSLRDAKKEQLIEHREEFNCKVFDRCLYVVEEDERVEKACNALTKNNFEELGLQMIFSHEGLRDKYEVSCRELDYLVEISSVQEGILGSRMMGGGFGGCTINLIKNDYVQETSKIISEEYRITFGKEPGVYVCKIVDGTKILS
jgi:galactokinase